MLSRFAALFLVLVAASSALAQEFFSDTLSVRAKKSTPRKVDSAWLDLRQTPAAAANRQVTPDWVEAISIVPGEKKAGEREKTVFRVRVSQPAPEAQGVSVRLLVAGYP